MKTILQPLSLLLSSTRLPLSFLQLTHLLTITRHPLSFLQFTTMLVFFSSLSRYPYFSSAVPMLVCIKTVRLSNTFSYLDITKFDLLNLTNQWQHTPIITVHKTLKTQTHPHRSQYDVNWLREPLGRVEVVLLKLSSKVFSHRLSSGANNPASSFRPMAPRLMAPTLIASFIVPQLNFYLFK